MMDNIQYPLSSYYNSKLLPSGEILLLPYAATQFAILSASDGDYGEIPDIHTLQSCWLNQA